MTKRLLIALGLLLLLAAILIATLHLNRKHIAEGIIINALEGQGLSDVSVKVERIWFDGAEATGISAISADGKPVTIGSVKLDWDYSSPDQIDLRNLAIKDAEFSLVQKGEQISFGGVQMPSKNTSTSPLNPRFIPETVELQNIRVLAETDFGSAIGIANGSYIIDERGDVSLRLTSDTLNWQDTIFKNNIMEFTITFSPNDSFDGRLKYDGDIDAAGQNFQKAELTGLLKGKNWKELSTDPSVLSAEISVTGEVPQLPVEVLGPALTVLRLLEKQPSSTMAARFDGRFVFDNGRLAFDKSSPDQTLSSLLSFDNGVSVSLQPIGSRDLIDLSATTQSTLAAEFLVIGTKAEGLRGTIETELTAGAPVLLNTEIKADRWADFGTTLAPIDLQVSGQLTPQKFEGVASIDAFLSEYKSESTQLRDIRTKWDFNVESDFVTGVTSLLASTPCANLGNTKTWLSGVVYSVDNVRLCRLNETRPVIKFFHVAGEAPHMNIVGLFTGSRANFTIGETFVTGQPPSVTVDIDMNSEGADAKASFQGGKAAINNILEVSNISAKSTFKIRDGVLSMDMDFSKVRARDLSTPEMFYPFLFDGMAKLRGQFFDFNGLLSSLNQQQFADVSGNYDLQKGEGEADLVLKSLIFTPNGFQPTAITPALKGYIENAEGEVDGKLSVALSKKDAVTSGLMSIKGLSFNGPTRAVTKTGGLSVSADFETLFPLKTRGIQTAKIDLIDLDALKLENGVVEFEATGDNTLYIRRAEWPWFNGQLRINKATIPLDLGISTVPMEIENIDLAALIAYFNVEGLSAEGKMQGTLPVIFEDGKARIENGVLATYGGGVVRYQGKELAAAANSAGTAGKLAIDALQEFRFDSLSLTINGALAGRIDIQIQMEGKNPNVYAGIPIKYRINIDAPISGLIASFQGIANPGRNLQQEIQKQIGVNLIVEEAQQKQPAKP